MTETLTIALAQMNGTVGDVAGNAEHIRTLAIQARDELHADLVLFPELSLTGYPPEDLLLRSEFLEQCEAALTRLSTEITGIAAVIGHPCRRKGGLANSASLLRDGRLEVTYDKQLLPNYSVFDEKRYFVPGHLPCTFLLGGVRMGITICEDVWEPHVVAQSVAQGAQLVLNLNASPYHIDKQALRNTTVGQRSRENHVPIVYVNMVGGQDELVFDGASFVSDAEGNVTQQAQAFTEGLYPATFTLADGVATPTPGPVAPPQSLEQSVYAALVTGVRDYTDKNRFRGATIGLSGGIDSALTLAVAVDALGADRVEAVMMPSDYTADISLADARAEAEALGVRYREIAITPIVQAVEQALAPAFAGLPRDTTEENIQARCRGLLLMALSNKQGTIVLTTGNKSEMAVGYATLYGDMVGGFAVIKDVPKMLVYKLSRYRNSISPVIPDRVITRAPSAELRPDQKDQDSLPPYDVLDTIVEMYVEEDHSVAQIAALTNYDVELVARVANMVKLNEYKRRQAAPGVRISKRAFGRDRRYPITSGFVSSS